MLQIYRPVFNQHHRVFVSGILLNGLKNLLGAVMEYDEKKSVAETNSWPYAATFHKVSGINANTLFLCIMKKNLLYLLALIILSALTWYFVFRDDTESFDKSEANFTVADTNAIKTIFLTNLHNENIKLDRTTKGWTLNDTLVPRMDAISSLLKALAQQKPEQAVPLSYHDHVVKDLSSNNTKVEIYTGKGKTHTFYVGKNPGPNNETYMLNENAQRPYIVKLPLQNTFVGIFYFNRIAEWRNKRILNGDTPIEYVDVVYKDSVQYSYKIEKSGNTYRVQGNSQASAQPNMKRVNDYIKLLDNLFCTGFEDTYQYKDSIVNKGLQLATVFLQRNDRPLQQITLYFTPVSQGTKKAIRMGDQEYDYDLFFGLVNKKDFVLISRHTAEKLLRSFPEFFQQDKP